MDNLQLGAHIRVQRTAYGVKYWHSGIISELNNATQQIKVIHFTGVDKSKATIQETTLQEFKGSDAVVEVVEDDCLFSPEEVVARARSKIGLGEYNLPSRNCEHFATWCRSDEGRSRQVQGMGIGLIVGGIASAVIGIALAVVGKGARF